MKIEQIDRRVDNLGTDSHVHVKYRLRFLDGNNNPIENEQVQVFQDEKLIFDADTNAEGVAMIEVLADIIKEMNRRVTFVVGLEQKRDYVFSFEVEVKQRENEILARERAQQQVCKKRISSCKSFFPALKIGVTMEDGKEALINDNGELLSGWFDEINLDVERQVAIIRKDNKYALLDLSGEKGTVGWCDELTLTSIDGVWTGRKDKKYYLYTTLDNGRFGVKKWNHARFESLKKGVMKTFTEGRACIINSEFEVSELVTFDQYLDGLRQANEITLAEYEKLKSLTRSYASAVKGANGLHPRGEVPTLEHVELELTQLGAAELRDICKHMQEPVLVIEPVRSFEENVQAMKAPILYINKNGEAKRKSLADAHFASTGDAESDGIYKRFPRMAAVTVHVAEGRLKVENKSHSAFENPYYCKGKRAIKNIEIGAYQSLLMGSIIDEKGQKCDNIIDQSHMLMGTPALLVSDDTAILSYSAIVKKPHRLCEISFLAIPVEICSEVVRMYYLRASMKLFEFTPESAVPG